MTKILLVQGANLTFLGRREPDIYGTTTTAELDAKLQRHAQEHGYHLDIFYTNVEGEAINRRSGSGLPPFLSLSSRPHGNEEAPAPTSVAAAQEATEARSRLAPWQMGRCVD